VSAASGESRTIIFSLCTNDEHGVDTGRVCAIQLDDAIDLHWGEIGSEPRYSAFRTNAGYILRLGRKRFNILGKSDWYGNWCWTAITMKLADAVGFLNHLSRDDRWHCEGGLCDLTDLFTEGKITSDILETL